MIIWTFMAIGLLVIVAGGFVERSRRSRRVGQSTRNASHKSTHHGRGAKKSRGRGKGR